MNRRNASPSGRRRYGGSIADPGTLDEALREMLAACPPSERLSQVIAELEAAPRATGGRNAIN